MRMMRTAAATAMLVLALAACGGNGGGDAAEAPPADTPPADTPPADTPPAEDADVAVASTDLGDVLVDAEGMTLYVFEPDEQGPSTCEDDCAQNWPPLVIDGDPVAGDGVDPGLLGTAERPDGATQVTYDGWPLYRWAADEAPGDTGGQGVGDVWWVIGPDGAPIRDAAEDAGLAY